MIHPVLRRIAGRLVYESLYAGYVDMSCFGVIQSTLIQYQRPGDNRHQLSLHRALLECYRKFIRMRVFFGRLIKANCRFSWRSL